MRLREAFMNRTHNLNENITGTGGVCAKSLGGRVLNHTRNLLEDRPASRKAARTDFSMAHDSRINASANHPEQALCAHLPAEPPPAGTFT